MRSDDLRQVEPFRDLDDHALARLAQEFVEIHLPAEYPVIREGSPVEAFFVVKHGGVVVYREAVGQPVRLLARVGPFEFFGEFALFTHCDSAVSARTTEPSCLLKIDKSTLLDFLDGQPAIALELEMAAVRRHTINGGDAIELGQRNEVRIRVCRHARLTLDDGSSHRVTVADLSSGGLSLKGAPEIWNEGDQVAFKLDFNHEVLPCEGRVAWVRGSLVGLAFTDPSADHDALIQRSLRRLLRTPRP